jgi:Protein of unknown function (DUF2743).
MSLNSHTDTLFHYTKGEETLLSILKYGLKFSYSKEDIIHDVFLAIPMISFCDIPLIMSLEHRMKYGKYAIGLSKKSLISDYPEGLNPVNYIICTQQYKAALQLYTDYLECKSNWKAMIYDAQRQGAPTLNFKCDGFEYFGVGLNNKASQSNAWNLFNEIGNKHRYAISMLGNMKKYEYSEKDKTQINYDECEWRLVIPENAKLSDQSLCKWYWQKKEYETWRRSVETPFVPGAPPFVFDVSDINYIIINDESSRPIFLDKINKLDSICGKIMTKEEKSILISKIMSFDQINNSLDTV